MHPAWPFRVRMTARCPFTALDAVGAVRRASGIQDAVRPECVAPCAAQRAYGLRVHP